MLCSKCSSNLLPIVALDIDGTIANYHRQVTRFAKDWTGRKDMPGDGEYWGGVGDFEDFLRMDKAEYREMKLAFRQGGQKRMMPFMDDMEGVVGMLHDQRSIGRIEVWITTHRPWRRLDNIDPDTQHWLKRFSIPYDHLLFSDDKYAELAQQVDPARVVAVVDDLQVMCLSAKHAGLPVMQRASCWNEGNRMASRGSWGDPEKIRSWILGNIHDWEANNERR